VLLGLAREKDKIRGTVLVLTGDMQNEGGRLLGNSGVSERVLTVVLGPVLILRR